MIDELTELFRFLDPKQPPLSLSRSLTPRTDRFDLGRSFLSVSINFRQRVRRHDAHRRMTKEGRMRKYVGVRATCGTRRRRVKTSQSPYD